MTYVRRRDRHPWFGNPAPLAMMSPVVALFNEGVASGMSMGAQAAGDDFYSPIQRELALSLTTVEQYARRVLSSPAEEATR